MTEMLRPNTNEWREVTDPTSGSWELHYIVNSAHVATIELDSKRQVRQVQLGPDYSEDNEGVIIEKRGGPFCDLDEAQAAIESVCRVMQF